MSVSIWCLETHVSPVHQGLALHLSSAKNEVSIGRIEMKHGQILPEKRCKIMSVVKGKNNESEMIQRSMRHKMGLRYRLHRKDLAGTPDLVLPKYRNCLFINGVLGTDILAVIELPL